jgi:hypothetical protein
MNNQELSVSHRQAGKLGKVSSISRLSRESCPSSCVHFGPDLETPGNCYATKIERIYPSVKKAYTKNLNIKDWQKYRSFLLDAAQKTGVVRIHVSGDFVLRDKIGRERLDVKYLNAWKKALASIPRKQLPKIWLYTHVADNRILELANYGVAVYGSVDSSLMHRKFKKAGFKLFAFNSEKTKGKKNRPDKNYELIEGKKIPICWEQLGTKDTCKDCDYCISGKGSIVFIQH